MPGQAPTTSPATPVAVLGSQEQGGAVVEAAVPPSTGDGDGYGSAPKPAANARTSPY